MKHCPSRARDSSASRPRYTLGALLTLRFFPRSSKNKLPHGCQTPSSLTAAITASHIVQRQICQTRLPALRNASETGAAHVLVVQPRFLSLRLGRMVSVGETAYSGMPRTLDQDNAWRCPVEQQPRHVVVLVIDLAVDLPGVRNVSCAADARRISPSRTGVTRSISGRCQL
jgi:hypothetical protein